MQLQCFRLISCRSACACVQGSKAYSLSHTAYSQGPSTTSLYLISPLLNPQLGARHARQVHAFHCRSTWA